MYVVQDTEPQWVEKGAEVKSDPTVPGVAGPKLEVGLKLETKSATFKQHTLSKIINSLGTYFKKHK